MSQSPNGLDTFWSHRLPRRHSLVHSHSDILITRTTSFYFHLGKPFVAVPPSVGPTLPFSFVCQPTYKACPKRFPRIVVMLSWCGAGSPAVLPSAFAPPALCSQSAAFPTTPGKSRRWIHRQIFSRFFHRCFSYGSSFSNIFHRLSGPAPPFPAIMARTRHMTAQARSTATNSSPPRPGPPPTPVAGQGRDASSTPQHARVAIPDPVAMGGSPSMMERFFPAGLPRRYTSQAEAVPSSIGSVISSSQERYGTLNPRMLPACEARKGLVVRWPRTGRMKEMGGRLLNLRTRMDKSHRVFAQFVQPTPRYCSGQQVLCDRSRSLQPQASRAKTHQPMTS